MRTDLDRTIDAIREKVEVLTGERASGARKAIRASDLSSLGNISVLTARHVTGTYPTAAEFNKLVNDVQALAKALLSIIPPA